VEAGEAGGILEQLLDRLAIYQEKTLAIKSKIKSALMYPIAVLVVAFVVVGDHDLRDPGLQGGVQLVRRRPAGADADRDRDVRVLRRSGGGLIFGLIGRRRLLLHADLEAVEKMQMAWTGCCCACRSSAT
jgi:hypothetical protein